MTEPNPYRYPHQQPMQQHQLPVHRPPRKVWPWLFLAIPFLLCGIGGCAALVASGSDTASAPTTVKRIPAAVVSTFTAPTSTLPIVPPPVPAGPATRISKDGTYLVGTQIQAGTYQSTGGDFCYWERLNALTGSFNAIITNGADEGQQFVTILVSDKAFKSQGCGSWELIPE